jgi:hypothetical protein
MSAFKTLRGIRNNNPGNLVTTKDVWEGMAEVQNDERFVVFKEAKYGIRAMAKVLRSYKKLHGIKTVPGVIRRWAPPSENNTIHYINSVVQHTGISGDIDLDDHHTLFRMIDAIIRYENGQQPYERLYICEAISLAFHHAEGVPTLPGAPIRLRSVGGTGYSQNAFGVGSMGISAQREGEWPWLDIGNVYFSDPTQEQMLDAATTPFGSVGERARSDIHRRLSFKQAQLVHEVMSRALTLAFECEIPADDEIEAWRLANGF